MTTFSGRRFWPVDPRPEDVHIEDIAHGLALENRFGGHTPQPYSVAQHSLLVADLVQAFLVQPNPQLVLWGLLHDASEAYLKDIPRPLKQSLPRYWRIEDRCMASICIRFGIPPRRHMPKLVKACDEIALATERRDVFAIGSDRWSLRATPAPQRIFVRPWQEVEAAFLARFTILEVQVRAEASR